MFHTEIMKFDDIFIVLNFHNIMNMTRKYSENNLGIIWVLDP